VGVQIASLPPHHNTQSYMSLGTGSNGTTPYTLTGPKIPSLGAMTPVDIGPLTPATTLTYGYSPATTLTPGYSPAVNTHSYFPTQPGNAEALHGGYQQLEPQGGYTSLSPWLVPEAPAAVTHSETSQPESNHSPSSPQPPSQISSPGLLTTAQPAELAARKPVPVKTT